MHTPKHSSAPSAAALLALVLAAACGPPDGGPGERDAPERGRPAIEVEPLRGPPGAEVRVSARDFPPDVVLDVGFGPPRSEYEVIARTQTDGGGSTAAVVRVRRGRRRGAPTCSWWPTRPP